MGEPSVFGRRLRTARNKRGLTQTALAEMAGVSPTMISHFETGERKFPSADNLVKLADALNVTTDFLLGRFEENDESPAGARALLRRTGLDSASEDVLQTVESVATALIEREQREDPNGSEG